MNVPKGFKILEHKDTRDDLQAYRERGATRGVYLGFPELHEHYTMALPGVSDWTGYPQSGKTEFLLELLLNTSLFYGWKHLLYVPDVGDKNEILATLIHKISGKTFDKRYDNHISENEADKELQWVLQHFFILYEEDESSTITPYEFWDFAVALKKEHHIQTATIDSWKDLRLNWNPMTNEVIGRDDKYLENVLKYRNKIADKYKLQLHTIIHPTNIPAEKDGKRPEPKPHHLSGGAQWFNTGRVMITVHRVDGSANEVKITVNKAKPKSVAKLGSVTMWYNTAISKYYWKNNDDKVYASKNFIKPEGKIQFDENDDDDIPF